MNILIKYVCGLVLTTGLALTAHSAQAYSYNSYEVTDLAITQTSTEAGASNDITVTFTIPSDLSAGMTTAGYISISTPYLYSYKSGSYTADYLNVSTATVSSSQLTVYSQGSSSISFYPKAALSAGSSVSVTITGAVNPNNLEGTGSFSLYGYESNTSQNAYNYFSASASQVYGEVDATVSVYDANGTTAVRNVYVGLYYYNSSNWSEYEYHYGYTNASGQVQFSGLTSGREYTVSFYYSGSTSTNSAPGTATLTYSGTVLSPSYSFLTSNVTTHFYADGSPVSGAYWYFYKTNYSNYTTDYVWRSGTTNSAGLISAAAQKDGNYTLSVYSSEESTYYTYNFTVTNGVVSGLSDPISAPQTEVSGTVYAGSSVAANVYLYIHNENWSLSRYVYTDSNGEFEFKLGESGTYKLEINSYGLPAGYFPADPVTVTVTAGTANTPLNLNLKAATKTIGGQVTKKASSAAGIAAGTPVADATVYAYQTTGNYNYAYTAVDSNGEFSLPVVGGVWSVYIYQQAWPASWAYTGGNMNVTFNSDSAVESAELSVSVVPYDAHITGRVLLPDGTPVGANAVYLYGYGGENNRVYSYAYTDASGNFDLKTTAGTFSLYMYAYGSGGSTSYSSPNLSAQTVGAGETARLGDISLVARNSFIQGSISIRDTKEAVSNHSVYAYKREGSTWDYASGMTDANGFFSLQVSPGEWTLQTYAGDVTSSTGKKVIYTGAGITLTVGDTETVTGQDFIFDQANAAFTFTAEDADGNDLTDEYGWVSIHQKDTSDAYGWYNTGCYVQRGTCTLNISSDQEYSVNYYSYRNWNMSGSDDDTHSFSHLEVDGVQTTTLLAGAEETIEVALILTTNSSVISGQFLDQDGTASSVNAYVYASSENNQWASTYVDGTSSYSLKLAPGTWRLSYWTAGSYQSTQVESKITIAADETQTLNFTVLSTNSVISGVVLDPDGNAVTTPTFVKVSTRYGKDETETGELYGLVEKTAYTNSSGEFTISVPSGHYYVTASSPDFLAPQPIQVKADSVGNGRNTKLRFLDSENTISGSVSDGVGITVNIQRIQSVGDTVEGAFVYGYCAGGSYTHTETDGSGLYVLDVPKNDTCYVGAVYQSGTQAYYSDQTAVSLKKNSVTQNINLNHALTLAESQTVKFNPQEGTVISLEDGTTIEVPANAITVDSAITEVTIVVSPLVQVVHQPGLEPLSVAYELTATDQNGNPISQFASDVKITIPYDESEVAEAGTDEDSLDAGYYEDAAGAWQNVDGAVVKNKQDNKFEMSVDHFSIFGVLSSRSILQTETDSEDGDGDGEDGEDGDDSDESDDTVVEVPVEEGVLGRPKKVKAKKKLEHALVLHWSAVDTAESYKVRVKNTKTGKVVKIVSTENNSKKIKKLKANQSYTISVKSIGATGSVSGWSEAQVIRTIPTAPTDVQISQVTTSSAEVTWTASAGKIKNYLVVVYDQNGTVIQKKHTKGTSLILNGLEVHATYQVKVRAQSQAKLLSPFSVGVEFTSAQE